MSISSCKTKSGLGFEHYMANRLKKSKAALCPQDAYKRGLELMVKAMDIEYRKDGVVLMNAIIGNTKRVEYQNLSH